MPVDVPLLGTLCISAALVVAAYTFAVGIAAGRGRPQMLPAARYGAYATCALIAVATLVLAYAFQSHDFRIRYVARYSDRSMPWWYLVTSLWGGQDGSLLWWTFLLGGWTTVCVRWMRGRYFELQPWVIATLMSIIMFFGITMLFAANPFSTTHGGVPPDGEGLNPLLQNYWMTIHPPTLYMGFVGWSVPFAFAVAALITGRLHDEWLRATRRWTLTAWLFLSIGLMLGGLWSYEELGWGGYWAWDPVENASLMPWLVGTAFLHSVMIQERYGMLKVWNVFLIGLTFFMTIFGTFLTRSGLIASVHSFARSDIGIYFVWYMVFLAVMGFLLMAWRLPEMRGKRLGGSEMAVGFFIGVVGLFIVAGAKLIEWLRLDVLKQPRPETKRPPGIVSMLSREFAFLLNNWILLAMMGFVLVLTTFPLISEYLQGQEVTVGPPVYNRWMVPFGIVLLVLAGVGPLISWRKATGSNLARAFTKPLAFAVVLGTLHVLFGGSIGFDPYVESPEIYSGTVGTVLQVIYGVSPVASVVACSFVAGCIFQEFWRGTRVRMRTKDESAFGAFVSLMSRARRRYGGYIVHLAVVVMFIGFTGAAYDVEKEATLRPGETMEVKGYELRYEQARMESDRSKRMLFTDFTVFDRDGDEIAEASPAKFIFRTHPQMPTTEVAILSGLVEDIYVIMSTVDPNTDRGTFRVIVRPLVIWIWIGFVMLIFGTLVAIYPTTGEIVSSDRKASGGGTSGGGTSGGGKGGGGAKASAALAVFLALGALGLPSMADAQDEGSSSLHAGTVMINDPDERMLFERLLCMCGDCQRLTLANCACGWAEDARAELRGQLARGAKVEELQEGFRAQHGSKAISIPSDEGLGRAMWAVPIGAGVLAAGGLVFVGRRWKKRGTRAATDQATSDGTRTVADAEEYDSRLDEELSRMEDS